jgi:hypothetical protein
MKNWLEKYIEGNRAYLDVEEPDDSIIWTGVSNQLNPSKNGLRTVLKMAATVAILVAFGYSLIEISDWSLSSKEMMSLSSISDDLARQEKTFQLIIYDREEEISSYDLNNQDLQAFYTEIKILDDYYEDYLQDLQEMGNHPQLIQSMLNYYELKIRILESMLNEIQKREHHENDQNVY